MTILLALFEDYLDDFDPTPQYLYDDWFSPMDFDTWLEDFPDELLLQRSQVNH